MTRPTRMRIPPSLLAVLAALVLAGAACDDDGCEGSEGHVFVDVYYDDGTLRALVDQKYGAGVVLINAALVDADG